MAWESDPTGGVAPSRTQRGGRRGLVAWLLLGLLLGSASVLIVRHEYYPPMSWPEYVDVAPSPASPSLTTTPPAVYPPTEEGASVQLSMATFTIPLTDPLPQLSAGPLPPVAPPAARWRLIIPARQSAYYDLRVDLDTPLTAAPQAGQVNLWYRAGETVTVLPGPAATLAEQAGHLIITVRGPALKQMFEARPSLVTIEPSPSAAIALRTLMVCYDDR